MLENLLDFGCLTGIRWRKKKGIKNKIKIKTIRALSILEITPQAQRPCMVFENT
jgi:hypothetical protein